VSDSETVRKPFAMSPALSFQFPPGRNLTLAGLPTGAYCDGDPESSETIMRYRNTH
jgi:hypothetical protein